MGGSIRAQRAYLHCLASWLVAFLFTLAGDGSRARTRAILCLPLGHPSALVTLALVTPLPWSPLPWSPLCLGHPCLGHPCLGHICLGHPCLGHPCLGHACLGHPCLGHACLGVHTPLLCATPAFAVCTSFAPLLRPPALPIPLAWERPCSPYQAPQPQPQR